MDRRARPAATDVWSLLEDRSGLVWVGTAGLGLNRLNPSTHRFHTLRAIPFNLDSLRSPFVWDMQEGPGRQIWFATLGGLESYDPATGHFRHFEPRPGVGRRLGLGIVQAVHMDGAGRFWVGSVDGHLYRFDPGNSGQGKGTFSAVHFPGRNDDRFSDDRRVHGTR